MGSAQVRDWFETNSGHVPPPPARNRRGEWHVDDVAVVPASIYPTYACTENGGTGWLARVVSCRGDGASAVARLCFLNARTSTGRPYEDVYLQPRVLRARTT